MGVTARPGRKQITVEDCMTEQLKPCPFCGAEAKHNGGGGSVFGRMWWAVGCEDCDIWMGDPEVWDKTRPGMLDPLFPPKICFTKWNRRAEAQP